MGDRALIQLRQGDEVSPVLYLHWDGGDAYYLIRKAERLMRERGPDLHYGFARLVGVACEHRPGCMSVGVWNATEPLTESDSHGDAGCLIVDLYSSGWVVTAMGGYFGRVEQDPGEPFGVRYYGRGDAGNRADHAALARLDAEAKNNP